MIISTPKLMDRMDWARAFPDKYFDVILDDPEFGIGAGTMAFTRETGRSVVQKNGKRLKVKKEPVAQKDWDKGTPDPEYWEEIKRISKNQIVFGIDYFKDWNGVSDGRVIWNKMRPAGLSFKPTEVAFQSFDNETHIIPCLWSGMMQAKSEFEPTKQQGNKKLNEKRIHVCQKPVILWKLLFREFNIKRGSIIGAPNFGSGTSRRACYDCGMEWYGCEIDIDFFAAAEFEYEKHVINSQIDKSQLKLWEV